jgi:hypothetical protein
MKCRTCRGPAIIELPRHNANFCAEHFLQLCRRQVEKAIHDHDMIQKTQTTGFIQPESYVVFKLVL